MQAVRADFLAYLLFRLVCADELVARFHIHAEIAREFDGRRAYEHMHFGRAACAEQADDLARSRTAHYAVVDEDEAFALDVAAEGVEFDLHRAFAHGLAGLDEGPADVAVLGERVHHGESAHVRVTSRAHGRAVGHAGDDVRIYFEELGKFLSAVVTRFVHADAVDDRIAAREVDVLEHAGFGVGHGVLVRVDPAVGGDDDHLAGFDVPYELRVHGVQRAGLAGEDDGLAFSAHDEGLQSVLVAHGDELVVRHAHDGERAEEVQAGFLHAVFHAGSGVVVDERGDDFAVHGGLEDVSAVDEPVLYGGGVDDVAVVGDRHSAVSAVEHDGLRVDDVARSACGVSDVSDGDVGVGQQLQLLVGEHLVDQPHVLVIGDLSSGHVDGDARALLTSVLQCEQTVIHFAREGLFFGRDHAENAALFMHAEFFLRE